MARTQAPLPPAAADAVRVLGQQIRTARQERGWTVADLAAKTQVSPPTVTAIEAGAPTVAIGTVLRAAVLLRIPLFGTDDPAELARIRLRGEERLELLPSRVRRPRIPLEVPDDF